MNAARSTRTLTALALLAPPWLGGCGAGEDLVAPRPGGLEVSAEQSGPGDDPDGILVVVDSSASHSLLPDSTLELPDLALGPHTLAVEGLGAGCTLNGPNPREVTVIPDSLVAVVLEIACATGAGATLVAAVETVGVDPDTDGYAVLLDTLPARPIGTAGTIAFSGLSADSHVVRLTGVADRCGVAGDNPQAFRVEALDTARIQWEVTCWPPANGRIAFVRIPLEGTGRNIFMINADGMGLTQLTRPEDNIDEEPEWSPDGTRVAYINDTSSFNRNAELRVVDVVSRTVLVIPTEPLSLSAPHWSPDGSQLSFEAGGGIYLVEADGRSPPRPLPGVGSEQSAAWSPNGTRMAFIGQPAPGESRVYVTDLNGTSPQPLSPAGLEVESSFHNIDWSPDGTRIVFAAAQPLGLDFGSDLYVMAVDGTEPPMNLTASPPFGSNLRPNWSPDGRRIVYACSDVSRSGTVGDICTISPDGGPPTNLTRNLEFYRDFGWSPDGSRIVFSRPEESGPEDLFFVRADGSGLARLTSTADNEFMPSWGR
jgi:Tol biopolymer transport system component